MLGFLRTLLPKAASSAIAEKAATVGFHRRQSLDAVKILACRICGAPGRYLTERSIHDGWRGCWVAPDDPRRGKPVGRHCPCCGQPRPDNQHLGEIWHRET